MPKRDARKDIVEVLEKLRDDMPVLARGIVREIRARVHEYDRVPLGDHAEHVQEQQERSVSALIEDRGPDAEDLSRAAALGRLRAAQGVSIEGVISAYHVGSRELWRLIDGRADKGREFLPQLAARMWEAIHATSTEIASAHSAVARARHTQSLTMRHRFVDLLERDEVSPELLEIAGDLGFDRDGEFVAALVSAGEGPGGVAEALHEELEHLDGVSFAVQQGAQLLIVAQGPQLADLRDLVLGLIQAPRAGIGLHRMGLAGARQSIRDAADALSLADAGATVAAFVDEWWLACLASQAGRLEPVLRPAREIVLSSPHLVDAVEAFADCGFSVSAAAKTLQVHPNSVAYRLDRWGTLTGWNPRTFQGLAPSLAVCAVVRREQREQSTQANRE